MTPETNGMVVSVRDLRTYIPPILSRKGKCLNIGAVLIPGPQAPRALRRALKLLIGELGAPRNRHRDLVIAAEEQIIDANLTYYDELQALLKRLTVDNEVHRAIRASFVRSAISRSRESAIISVTPNINGANIMLPPMCPGALARRPVMQLVTAVARTGTAGRRRCRTHAACPG